MQGGEQQVQRSLGSGVLVDASGLVVTNNHVIEGADQVKVSLSDKREFEAEIVLKDTRSDLAVLRLKDPGRDNSRPSSSAIPIRLQVGDVVLAIGNPFAVGQTVTHGIVSAVARTQVGITDYQFFIQTDAAINPGNSGGALVDVNGRLVGINTAIFSRSGGSQGIGFAIPANMVKVVVASAKGGGSAVKRPWLGAKLQAVTSEIAESLGVKRPTGALVASVTAGSPAARGGLKVGDLITTIDGQEVEDPNAFDYRFATKSLGGSARVGVVRSGKEAAVTVALEPLPDTPHDELTISTRSPFQGAKVSNLSPALADDLRLDPSTDGVVITAVSDGSPAQSLGFKPGDLVVSVNNQKIAKTRDLEKATSQAEPRVAHHHHARRPADVRGLERMSPKASPKRGGPNLFAAAGLERSAPRPLADKLRPDAASADVVGQDHLLGPDGALSRMLGHAHARLAGVLGPSRHRQDHGGAAAGGGDRPALRADLGDLLRRRRAQEGVRGGARAAGDRTGDAAVRRRDPSLQPRPAGFVPAGDGGRHHRAHRCHHRKSLLRAQRAAAVARPRAGVQAARRRPRSSSSWDARRRSRAGPCRSTARRAPPSSAWPTATAAPP